MSKYIRHNGQLYRAIDAEAKDYDKRAHNYIAAAKALRTAISALQSGKKYWSSTGDTVQVKADEDALADCFDFES